MRVCCCCSEVRCGYPGDIADGYVSLSSYFTYANTATYNCRRGYRLVAEEPLVCAANRSWVGRRPHCQRNTHDTLHHRHLNCRISETHTHSHTFNGPFSWTTRVSRYQKGKTDLDFTEARDTEWQWHQLGHMQVCISLQTDNHASRPTPPLRFLQAGCPSCRPTYSARALKAKSIEVSQKLVGIFCLNL